MFIYIVVVFVAFFGTAFGIATFVKLRQERAVSRWPSVHGVITSGAVEARSVTTVHAKEDGDKDVTEIRNFARIYYRYVVKGRNYTGSRISISEDLGNDDVEARIARYPKGRAVDVFYDPADPGKAVLERGLPAGCAKAGVCALALVAAIIAIFGFGLDYATDLIEPHIRSRGDASSVVFAATFSVLVAYFGLVLWRQGWSARKWPRVPGMTVDGGRQGLIVYRYKVGNVSYTSSHVVFGMPQRTVYKLPSGLSLRGDSPGQAIEVLYNPANPAEACLDPRSAGVWLAVAISVIVAGLAWIIADMKTIEYRQGLRSGDHGIGLFTGAGMALGDIGDDTTNGYKDPTHPTDKLEIPRFAITVLHELGYSIDARWKVMEGVAGNDSRGAWRHIGALDGVAAELAGKFLATTPANSLPAAAAIGVAIRTGKAERPDELKDEAVWTSFQKWLVRRRQAAVYDNIVI